MINASADVPLVPNSKKPAANRKSDTYAYEEVA